MQIPGPYKAIVFPYIAGWVLRHPGWVAEFCGTSCNSVVALTPMTIWKKSSIRKGLIILFGHLWVVELTYRYIFHFKVTAVWYCANSVLDIGGIFTANGVNQTSGTGGKICHWCRWYWWCTLTWEYLREFLNKFETPLMLFSGAWRKVIYGEKNQKQKISWHCPLSQHLSQVTNILYIKLQRFLNLRYWSMGSET